MHSVLLQALKAVILLSLCSGFASAAGVWSSVDNAPNVVSGSIAPDMTAYAGYYSSPAKYSTDGVNWQAMANSSRGSTYARIYADALNNVYLVYNSPADNKLYKCINHNCSTVAYTFPQSIISPSGSPISIANLRMQHYSSALYVQAEYSGFNVSISHIYRCDSSASPMACTIAFKVGGGPGLPADVKSCGKVTSMGVVDGNLYVGAGWMSSTLGMWNGSDFACAWAPGGDGGVLSVLRYNGSLFLTGGRNDTIALYQNDGMWQESSKWKDPSSAHPLLGWGYTPHTVNGAMAEIDTNLHVATRANPNFSDWFGNSIFTFDGDANIHVKDINLTVFHPGDRESVVFIGAHIDHSILAFGAKGIYRYGFVPKSCKTSPSSSVASPLEIGVGDAQSIALQCFDDVGASGNPVACPVAMAWDSSDSSKLRVNSGDSSGAEIEGISDSGGSQITVASSTGAGVSPAFNCTAVAEVTSAPSPPLSVPCRPEAREIKILQGGLEKTLYEKTSDITVEVYWNSGPSCSFEIEGKMKDDSSSLLSPSGRQPASGAGPMSFTISSAGLSTMREGVSQTLVAVFYEQGPNGKYLDSMEKSFALKTPQANVPELPLPLVFAVLAFFLLLVFKKR